MTIFALTPEEFQTAALAWVGAGFAVVTAICVGLAVLLPRLATLKAAVDAIHTRQTAQETRQNAQGQSITKVALAIAPTTVLPVASAVVSAEPLPPAEPPR